MNAKEFIKQYGWDYAKLYANGWITFDSGCVESDVSRDDVKQLVDAWEFVEKHGGLDMAKDLSISQVGLSKHYLELKQAIELVESVNENN